MSLWPNIIPARSKLVLGYRLHNRMKINTEFDQATMLTIQEENFHWNLNFAKSLMANTPNQKSAYYYIFRNLSMKSYMIEIKKSDSAIFNSMRMTNPSQVAKLNTMYIFNL